MKIEKKPYDKSKSFINFKSLKKDENYKKTIKKIKIVLSDKNKIIKLDSKKKRYSKLFKKRSDRK